MRLYQIVEEYDSVLNELFDPDTGEINETSLTRLNEVEQSIETKAIAVSAYIKNLEAEQLAITNAIEDMKKREKQLENKVNSLRDYLKYNMEKVGHTEISCPYFSIKIRKNPVSVDILDETLIPDKYKQVRQTIYINKSLIKSAIQDGLDIKGVKLMQNTSLVIK